jgi:hypothetical protein
MMPPTPKRFPTDVKQLTDEFHAFVTDPAPSRGDRPFIQDLHEAAPEMVEVLEHMVLDGVEAREDVAAYAEYLLNQ